jgi:hypothetical protein
VDCGQIVASQPPEPEPAAPRIRGLSSHSNLDPAAAYKLIHAQPAAEDEPGEAPPPKYGPLARRQEVKPDALRDERMVCISLAVAATAFNLYMLLFTERGMDNIEVFTSEYGFLPDPQTFSNLFIGTSVLGLGLLAAGLFLRGLWVKRCAALLLIAVMLCTAFGMLTPGSAADICNSLQGWISIVVSLWLLIFFSRDIPNTVTGDNAL